MIRILLSLMAICSSLLFANDSCSLINSYNPAVKDGANVWINMSLLYWKPWERALVATNKKSNVFITEDFTLTPVIHPNFEWDLGFRLSSGYLFDNNHWDVEVSWEHFTSRVSDRHSTNGNPFQGMFPIWSLTDDVISGDYVFTSDLKWKFSINVLDLQFGRYFNTFTWLDLKPYVGLRSAWVRQHGDIDYKGGIFLIGILGPGTSLNGTDHVKMRNNYWGIGPRIGIDPRIILGKGFSLNAKAAISGLYGFFKVKQTETYLATTRFSKHQHLNRFRAIADFAAGAAWKKLFQNERYGLTLSADWEYQLFLRQFEFKKDKFGLVPGNRNLSVQGVTFSARCDF